MYKFSLPVTTPADSNTSKQYRLGILMVHGIGTQARRGTLVAWGDILLSVIRRAAGGSAIPTVEQAWGGDQLGDVPAEAVVAIRSSGGKETWLLEECWWADTFPAPTYSELVSWSLRALPWSVCLHIAQRYWQTASKDAGTNWAAVAIALSQFAVAFVAAPFFLIVLAAVLLLGLLPIPQLRTFALNVQSTLTATIGDSLAFVESPIRAALIRTRILAGLARLKPQCDRTIIVAHSQGAAAVLDDLGGFADPQAGNTDAASAASTSPSVMPDALFTFGAGINQLASLRVLSRGLRLMIYNIERERLGMEREESVVASGPNHRKPALRHTLQGKELKWEATRGSVFEGISAKGRRALKDLRQHRGVGKGAGVHRRLLYKWRDQFAPFDENEEPATGSSPQATIRRKLHQLKRVLVDKTLEVDFFKGALQKVEARRQRSGRSGAKASTTTSKK